MLSSSIIASLSLVGSAASAAHTPYAADFRTSYPITSMGSYEATTLSNVGTIGFQVRTFNSYPNTNALSRCQTACNRKKYTYSGFGMNTRCFCTNSLGNQATSTGWSVIPFYAMPTVITYYCAVGYTLNTANWCV